MIIQVDNTVCHDTESGHGMSVNLEVANLSTKPVLAHKDLIEEELWERLVNRIVKDEDVTIELAERIMNEALAFLKLCALDSKGSYSPSPLVDIGWHTFILYTWHYAAFCEKLAGRFIHHEPSDVSGTNYGTGGISQTVDALKRHGFAVDEPLWANTGDCQAPDCTENCSGRCQGRPK